MQTIPENIDLHLPYGECLRGLLEQPFISAGDLKHTLRARGIFLGRNEKRDSIPVLACCLLSPREFDDLRERQATKEDNLKTITRTLAWKSKRPILEAIPDDLDLAVLAGEYSNYRVLGTPKFVSYAQDQNAVCLEFEIEREDLSKNWASTKNHFKGKLRLEKLASGKAIRIVLTNTSEETRDLNHRIVQRVTAHFKEAGDVGADSEIEKIAFSAFGNESRIAFFRSLAKDALKEGFEFQTATDLGVCPDAKSPLPPDLKWMEDHVRGLRIHGVSLQDTFFMKSKYNYLHRFFLFYSMEARFKFDVPVGRGRCSIVFEFSGFEPKKDLGAEFEVNISSLSLDSGQSGVSRTSIKEELLRRMNERKLALFERYRLHDDRRAIPKLATAVPRNPVELQSAFDWA